MDAEEGAADADEGTERAPAEGGSSAPAPVRVGAGSVASEWIPF